MSADRYVVFGLAQPRAAWFSALGRWSTAGSLPVDFAKCLSVEELHLRLSAAISVSAVLLDEGLASTDRDLLAAVRQRGAAAIVVVVGPPRRDWLAVGADAVLGSDFDPHRLAEVLRQHARPVGEPPSVDQGFEERLQPAPLVAVCGPGGTGVSSAAAALAQGLGRHGPDGAVLVDMAVPGEQAMLHAAADEAPALLHLVEGHRRGRLDRQAMVPFLWAVEERGYHLVTGLRRSRSWPALRPWAVQAAIDSLTRSFSVVVCDVDADVDGERETGSIDLEERNALSRTALSCASAAVVVGGPGMKGAHSLARVVGELVEFGVDPGRVVPVVNRVPRGRRAAMEIRATARSLLPRGVEAALVLPDRSLEAAWRDVRALPDWLVGPLAERVVPLLNSPVQPSWGPTRLRPGSAAGLVPVAEDAVAG